MSLLPRTRHDIALPRGGLIASLRELGQSVTILTLFSGSGNAD